MATQIHPFVESPALFRQIESSKAYLLRQKLDNGEKLTRNEKDWLTDKVNSNSYFKQSVPVLGWRIPFDDILRKYWVMQKDHILEYYAVDKTSLRAYLYGRIDYIIEITSKTVLSWQKLNKTGIETDSWS